MKRGEGKRQTWPDMYEHAGGEFLDLAPHTHVCNGIPSDRTDYGSCGVFFRWRVQFFETHSRLLAECDSFSVFRFLKSHMTSDPKRMAA